MNRTPLLNDSSPSQLLTPNRDFDWLGSRALPMCDTTHLTDSARCLLSPMHYEKGYAYPLIVWMHSSHSDEEELCQVMPLVSSRNYVTVAPRGTQSSCEAHNRYCWGQSSHELAEASGRVRQCIEVAKNQYNVHPNRIYVAGYADGGTMALRVGMENPELFAGAISLGGQVPRGSRPLRNINRARQLPLLLSVSPDENGYSSGQVQEDLQLLHYAGFSLSLRLYPEGGGLCTEMLSDFNKWIMESFCPSTTPANS